MKKRISKLSGAFMNIFVSNRRPSLREKTKSLVAVFSIDELYTDAGYTGELHSRLLL